MIEEWHEYLKHVFLVSVYQNVSVFWEWYGSNEARFSALAAVTQTCSALCPPLTCTCSLMSWRRKKRWRGGPLLPSAGQHLHLLLYLIATNPQLLLPPHRRRRCSQCFRMHTTAMNAGTLAWYKQSNKAKVDQGYLVSKNLLTIWNSKHFLCFSLLFPGSCYLENFQRAYLRLISYFQFVLYCKKINLLFSIIPGTRYRDIHIIKLQ